ncbi:eCIS core domain-containing protein [Coleofasciculus sp. F4-SAH-05]|uniref:eCIS core domain-containing protein n=1 Tax=Coleofasciculus sp. F4-SAH-05 TaxID=3069525 RepID=UPI0032F934AB
MRRQRAHVKGRTSVRPYGWFWDFFIANDIKIYQTETRALSGDLLTWFYSHRLYLIIMSTHQSIPKPANAKKKSDILPIPAQSKSHPVIAQPKIESTRSNEEQLAQMRAQREASERLGSTLLTPESVPRKLPPLQPKLTIGQPGDQYEQEADRVARQVVDHINAPPKIQAKETHQPMSVGERKPSKLDHLPVSRVQRYGTGGDKAASPDLESSIQRARGGGQPLGDGIRERMEGAFGADFSGVRVHTDGTSDQLNQSIQAKAFTTGQDVFFRKGAYEPGSRGGQELLAHELTHVVQQHGGEKVRNQLQQMNATGEQKKRPSVKNSDNLYHGAPSKYYDEIKKSGLKPLSGRDDDKYLCMTTDLNGVATLERKANDIIYKVETKLLNEEDWYKEGAGYKEWRSRSSVSANLLQCRRSLGNKKQTSWRNVEKGKNPNAT